MRSKRNLHWIHNQKSRRAPAKMPGIWSYWLSRWDSENKQWNYQNRWHNEDVPVSYGLVDETGVLIFHSALGEIWLAVSQDAKWTVLSEQEIGYAARRFQPVVDNVQMA